MHHRPLRRAIALSLGALLAFAGVAAADTVRADGDVTTPVIETTAPLGAVAPGSVHVIDIGFVLTCANHSHVDAGQTVTATFAGAIEPLDGRILSVTDGTVGPAPADWPADGSSCPIPAPTFSSGTASIVTLRAPTTPGAGYTFSLMFDRSISPAGADDSGALRFSTAIDIRLDVNTRPTLALPASFTVEGDTANGWTADWSAVSATDPEDAPDPVPTCTPGAGSTLPLGRNTVSCSVTDLGGLTATGSFDVTVVDTTAPVLVGVPADSEIITNDPAGTTVAYASPTATDVVDPAPDLSCTPASGDHVGTGPTTVSCTARDASENSVSDSFDVTVTYVALHTASAIWHEPVDGTGSVFSANRGRTLPIKVRLFVDGSEVSTGSAALWVTPCDGGTALDLALTYGGGRWNASLDTSALVGSCHTVTAWVEGLPAGTFALDIRGTEPVRARNGRP